MLQRLYFSLPFFLQSFALTLFGFFNDLRRYGGHYSQIEKTIKNRSADDLKEFQKSRLSAFLINARKSEYWDAKFSEYDVNPLLNPFEEIKKLPILTKKEVKDNFERITIRDNNSKLISIHTSGTTGSGLVFFESKQSEAERWATWWRYREAHGITRGEWCALFGGRSIISPDIRKPPFHRVNYASKQVLFSCYHLSEDTVANYIQVIENKRLNWIHGYPSFISEVASLAISNGIKLKHKPQFITLGAENLSAHQERIIECFFGVKPIQHYGLAESTANFSQLKGDKFLTVDEDFAFVEFLEHSEEKKIIGTNLSNLNFPLIRYDTGDLASDVNETVFPRHVGFVDGRSEDVITLSDGKKIGRLDHIFKDSLYVDEAQIYQEAVGSIEVRIKKNHRWSDASERDLRESFTERLGSSVEIKFVYVNKIPRTKSGKLRFVISEVYKK